MALNLIRQATPERWAKAAARAISEGVTVRQVASTGQWVANSGTRPGVAYLLDVTADVVTACTCEAALFGDPVCKHRAAFYLSTGVLHDPDDGGTDALVAA